MAKWYRIDLRKTLRLLTEYLTYALLIIITVDFLIKKIFDYSFIREIFSLTNSTDDYRITLIFILCIFVGTNIMIAIRTLTNKVNNYNNDYHGVIEIIKPYNQIDYIEFFKSKQEIKILALSGSITGDLSNNEIIEVLKNPSKKKKIIILLGNPFCQSIINRYKYDEVNHVAGTEGIKRKLKQLYDVWYGLSKANQKKLIIKVYNNYPTISIIQGDNDFYSSTYGYKLRGNACPTTHSEKGKGYGLFLENHFNRVFKDSASIEEWYNKYKLQIDE